jgi:hypothetical protein
VTAFIGVSTYIYECLRLYCYLQKRRVILYVCIMAKVGTFFINPMTNICDDY